jgi:hypothetical protein
MEKIFKKVATEKEKFSNIFILKGQPLPEELGSFDQAPKKCYLAEMPEEIKMHIFSFLAYERPECIERLKKMTEKVSFEPRDLTGFYYGTEELAPTRIEKKGLNQSFFKRVVSFWQFTFSDIIPNSLYEKRPLYEEKDALGISCIREQFEDDPQLNKVYMGIYYEHSQFNPMAFLNRAIKDAMRNEETTETSFDKRDITIPKEIKDAIAHEIDEEGKKPSGLGLSLSMDYFKEKFALSFLDKLYLFDKKSGRWYSLNNNLKHKVKNMEFDQNCSGRLWVLYEDDNVENIELMYEKGIRVIEDSNGYLKRRAVCKDLSNSIELEKID